MQQSVIYQEWREEFLQEGCQDNLSLTPLKSKDAGIKLKFPI